jgi:hypothetical protein
MRSILLLLVLALVACDRPTAPTATAASPTTTVPSSAELPSWNAPTIERTADRVAFAQHLVVRVEDPRAAGAEVDAVVALGPTPAACDDDRYDARTLTPEADGSFVIESVSPDESVTLCVRDGDHHVRASATSRGYRSVPYGYARWEHGRVHVQMTAAELDDDVQALVITTRAGDAASEGTCVAEATTDHDDAPMHCEYACTGHVALEIPRARWNAAMDSPLADERSVEGEDYPLPPALGWSLPIDVPAGDDGVQVCVRTEAGAIVSDRPQSTPIADGPWQGCALDTIAGCYGADGGAEIAVGDTALGLDADGRIVHAIVRAMSDYAVRSITARTTRGVLSIPEDRYVRAADGRELAVDALHPGDVIWSRWGEAVVRVIEPETYDANRVAVDLAGASWALVSGFAIRDAGAADERGASAFVDTGLASDQGGDCSLTIDWPAVATPALALRIAPLNGRDHHDEVAIDCARSVLTSLDVAAPTLAAVAALAPDARISVELGGGPVQCDTSYRAWRCDASAAPIGSSITARSSPSCIATGTPIDTPRGPVAIEKLATGEELWSYDDRRGVVVAHVIGSTTHRGRDVLAVTLEDGTELRATPDHVMMVGVAPTPRVLRSVSIGDLFSVHRDGTVVALRVRSITPAPSSDVVELRVTAPDTYFANGVLVHNY